MSDAISMKVPTKSVKEVLIECEITTSFSGAAIHVEPYDNDGAVVEIRNQIFRAIDARQAAQFFNNLANVLEGKEQE